MDKANKQLVGKIEDEHSLFYHGEDQTKIKISQLKLTPLKRMKSFSNLAEE